jgi:hypothetical protein
MRPAPLGMGPVNQLAYGKFGAEFKQRWLGLACVDAARYRDGAICSNVATHRKQGVLSMTWYVDPKSGNDDNDGKSAKTAFKRLWHAVQAASAGDTIVILPGAYDEELPQLVGAARVGRIHVEVAGGH